MRGSYFSGTTSSDSPRSSALQGALETIRAISDGSSCCLRAVAALRQNQYRLTVRFKSFQHGPANLAQFIGWLSAPSPSIHVVHFIFRFAGLADEFFHPLN